MIVTRTETINGQAFVVTASDSGYMIERDGALYTNTPDAAPILWEDIAYRQGYCIIPATITAGAAFAQGECGWWGDTLYRSTIASNVWTPDAYPARWEAVQ